MRLLFATDLHGNEAAYRRLAQLAQQRGVQAVVLGGDLFPHASGAAAVAQQSQFITRALRACWQDLLRRVPELAIFAVLGNDDLAGCMPAVAQLEAAGLWRLVHERAMPCGEDWFIAGGSWVPVTPFALSDFDRLDEEGWRPPVVPARMVASSPTGLRSLSFEELARRPSIAAELEQLATASPPARTIYVVHTPPHNTALDLIHDGSHVGSRALRRFVERHQPPLTLHGHIHESPRRSGRHHDYLGRTLLVNPGASLAGLQAAELDLNALAPPEILT